MNSTTLLVTFTTLSFHCSTTPFGRLLRAANRLLLQCGEKWAAMLT